ncbi:PRTRC system protein B [Duganella sp. FT92W]|uniref:PRTRC system protein B n=1 Tax=Pseudoduganella rivuli TaxID=2666085 RepID=A0A7X2IIP4_9BURK|nr:PRTRC system protein B [Pseudoduganella rivuli]MRV70599.1 PRTRC system protein B [Pseudoduganella rivuli]
MTTSRLHLDLRESAALTLTSAILIYHANNGRECGAYASIHSIAMEGGQPYLMAGKPLMPRAALSLARALSPTTQTNGFLPANVLYAQADLLMWWQPACRRHIAFQCSADTLGVRGGVVPHPALLFCAGRHGWRVWALSDDVRPTPETALYQAPYFNVNREGQVCTGTAAVPRGIAIEQIDEWEDVFFRSQFTHPSAPKLVSHRRGAFAFWRAMLNGRYKTFPQHLLVPLKRTLGEQVLHMAQVLAASERRP